MRKRYWDGTLLTLFVAAVALLANLNALVDRILHPAIPYLDPEHLIVGGTTGLVGAALLFATASYAGRYFEARRRIQRLESLLSICAHCKRIRHKEDGSWVAVESFFSERDGVDFSHGVCPECERAHYSGV